MNKSNLSYNDLCGIDKQAAQNMGLFTQAVKVVLDTNTTNYEKKDLYNVYISYPHKQPEKML